MNNTISTQAWYDNAVLYQIYPRSFQDSNGDGIGDLNGIRQRLDYLNDGNGGGLGVDCIWISPFYPSPMKDFGYDISDYRGVDPVFGTMEDFDNLLAESHQRGIRMMIDLVPNHTSDQHEWFLESKQSKDNPKADWYIWRDAKPDGSVPNNWISMFGGSVWEWCEDRQQYYLHSFVTEQPDLNWENPDVREAMADMMRYWLDKGVDGFRVDAIDFMGKDASYDDEPANLAYIDGEDPYNKLSHTMTRHAAGNCFDYLRMMSDVVSEYDDRLVILESYILERHRPELYWMYYKEIDKPSSLPFNFELIFMDWSASEIQKFVDAFQGGLRDYDLPVYVLGNHDQQRFATKAGPQAVRNGALILFGLPGISLIYNGEELGMHDVQVPEELRTDVNNRDACRTPMQWSSDAQAGFTTGTPWLPVGDDYPLLNAATQSADQSSTLNLYRTLIHMQKDIKALREGQYVEAPHFENVVSFVRKSDQEELLFLANFSDQPVAAEIEGEYKLILSTIANNEGLYNGALAPFEGVILEKITT